ncbi:MAG TPA: hypothetical protein VF832_05050, partial [Longimicrobiales bacterium]
MRTRPAWILNLVIVGLLVAGAAAVLPRRHTDTLLVSAPSYVVAGRSFTVHAVPLTTDGEAELSNSRKVTARIEGQDTPVDLAFARGTLRQGSTSDADGFRQGVATLRAERAGWYRVEVTDGRTTVHFPIRAFSENPPVRLYWGEIHTHSSWDKDAVAGALDPERAYTWGRDVALLDFGSVVVHHWSVDDAAWARLERIDNEF